MTSLCPFVNGAEFDDFLVRLAWKRYYGYEDKTVIEPIHHNKKFLIYNIKDGIRSVLFAYKRAYRASLKDWDPAVIHMVPRKTRRMYAEEIAHACMELKYFQHACGVIKVC